MCVYVGQTIFHLTQAAQTFHAILAERLRSEGYKVCETAREAVHSAGGPR